jgi:hypothetical protein
VEYYALVPTATAGSPATGVSNFTEGHMTGCPPLREADLFAGLDLAADADADADAAGAAAAQPVPPRAAAGQAG